GSAGVGGTQSRSSGEVSQLGTSIRSPLHLPLPVPLPSPTMSTSLPTMSMAGASSSANTSSNSNPPSSTTAASASSSTTAAAAGGGGATAATTAAAAAAAAASALPPVPALVPSVSVSSTSAFAGMLSALGPSASSAMDGDHPPSPGPGAPPGVGLRPGGGAPRQRSMGSLFGGTVVGEADAGSRAGAGAAAGAGDAGTEAGAGEGRALGPGLLSAFALSALSGPGP
ncbi:unnamed protein product, partial [Discosporangium mesarthrocarpum]